MEPGRPAWESPVEKAIREAQERGEFDNLPGAGKPLPDFGDRGDLMWWVRRYAEREKEAAQGKSSGESVGSSGS